MGKIILEEFRKLSDKEKCKRYKDMSDKDKYMFRITDPTPFMNVKTIGYAEMTEEEKKENEMKKKEIIEAIRRNKNISLNQ